MDRTNEFKAFLRPAPSLNPSLAPEDPLRSAFNATAAELGTALHRTQQRLTELAKVSKSRSVFNDQSDKVGEMTLIIKEDIASLTERISDLSASGGSSGNKHMSAHAASVCNTLNFRLSELTRSFKEILELRTKTLQGLEDRRGKYGANTFGARQELDIESGQTSSQMLATGNSYNISRANAAVALQGMIAEIGQLFNKMSHMIVQQEEMVRRIDADVEGASDNVGRGHSELLKYFNNISGNRGLILKVFAVIIFFVVFFALFS